MVYLTGALSSLFLLFCIIFLLFWDERVNHSLRTFGVRYSSTKKFSFRQSLRGIVYGEKALRFRKQDGVPAGIRSDVAARPFHPLYLNSFVFFLFLVGCTFSLLLYCTTVVPRRRRSSLFFFSFFPTITFISRLIFFQNVGGLADPGSSTTILLYKAPLAFP